MKQPLSAASIRKTSNPVLKLRYEITCALDVISTQPISWKDFALSIRIAK